MNLSFKKLLTILLIVLLMGTLTLTLLACTPEPTPSPDPDPVDEEPIDEEVLIIKNGRFINTTGTTYPLAPTDWTGSIAGTGAPQGTDNLLAGVISVDETKYNDNKAKWDNLANPGKVGEDDNILMIYNKTMTSYRYTNSFSAEIGKYYKVSIPVRTIVDEGKGAYIYLSGGAYAAFEAIDTGNAWTTYTVYIESSLVSKENITLNIAMGYGTADGGNFSKGYAFYDEVLAEEITSAQYIESTIDAKTAKYSLRVPDSRMENTTGTTQPLSPAGWSTKVGTGAGGNAPSFTSDLTRGVVITSDWKETYGANPGNPVEGFGDKILMIKNNNATAAGYAGRNKIRFEIGKYYELSVNVYVKLTDGQDKTEFKGATLALTGTDNFKMEYVDTAGVWVNYSFFVEANEVRNKDFTLELWLGQGGKEDTDTLTKGVAFFDNIILKEITENTFNTEKDIYDANPDIYPNYIASLLSTNPNLITNNNLENIDPVTGLPVGWASESPSKDVIVNDGEINRILIPESDLDIAEWNETLQAKYFGLEANPHAPYPIMAPAYLINHSIPTVSGMGLVNALDIKPNTHYRMAIWLKTIDIEEGKGVTLKLVSGSGEEINTLSSFTNINTAAYENEYTNDYLEIVFLIQGNELLDKDARLVIEMGAGTAFNPTNYVRGSLILANVNMEQINYTEYNSASASTYIKKYSFTTSSATISNGNFDKLDLSKTDVDENGQLIDKPGTPESWTISSSTEANITSGVINADNEDLLTALGLTREALYNNDGWDKPFPVDFGGPNLLMLQSKAAIGEFDGRIDPIGYASNNFTLSSNSYYIVKVYVKTVFEVGDTESVASVMLSPTTNTNPVNHVNITTNGKWAEFVFVVATGRNSVSTKLELFLGNKKSNTKVAGSVFFDSASYLTIDKDEFEALSLDTSIISLSYQIETFDNVKTNTGALDTPNNWTGAIGNTSLPSGTNNVQAGVFSYNDGNASDLGVKDADGNIIPESMVNNDEIRDTIFDDEQTIIGENVLIVNNKVPTAYNFRTSSAETLQKNSYYEISVWAFTYFIDEGKSARVMLAIGEDTWTFKDVNTTQFVDGEPVTGTWSKYSYYVKTAETANASSTYLTLGLGRYLASDADGDLLVKGYAFYDNVSITTIEKDDFDTKLAAFNAAKEEAATDDQKKFLNNNIVISLQEPATTTPSDPTDDEDPVEEPGPADQFPWLLVSSLIIGGVILIAVIVVVFKKVYPKIAARRKTKFKKTTYDRTTSKDKTTTKSKRYDKYKD